MASTRFFALALMGAALGLSACGNGSDTPEPATSAPTETAGAAQPAAQSPNAPQSSLWRGGETVPLDIQVAHPNGVVLQVTSLQSRQTDTAVGVRILNGSNNEVQLNRFNNRRGYIVVDSGERIYISPPASNTALTVQPGQTLEGELVFLGRLPRSQGAVMVLNENSSGDNQYSRTPSFRIDLPLSSAGATDGGS